ncbi:hypothetical protein QN277_008303 [Acacia crassicarpa]|uniref:Uncharacterized protein n=1 Tax=Acacia crassicarpa TaxID=499986 RepID=A0AAE1IR72_9FABA|nr:hypothetical protein QN277_008303 [Acacia crassicarpa]
MATRHFEHPSPQPPRTGAKHSGSENLHIKGNRPACLTAIQIINNRLLHRSINSRECRVQRRFSFSVLLERQKLDPEKQGFVKNSGLYSLVCDGHLLVIVLHQEAGLPCAVHGLGVGSEVGECERLEAEFRQGRAENEPDDEDDGTEDDEEADESGDEGTNEGATE